MEKDSKNPSSSKIIGINQKINKEIYGIDKGDDFSKDIEEIENSINNISKSYRDVAGNDIVEFLDAVAFNNANSQNIGPIRRKGKFQKKDLSKLLNKQTIESLFTLEKSRTDKYEDFRILYSYIPQLATCVDNFVDCIVSPDDLTGNILPVKYKDKVCEDETNSVYLKIKKLKEEYKFDEKGIKAIRKAVKEGDCFVAVLAYDDEFNRYLMNESSDDIFLNNKINNEDSHILLKEDLNNDKNLDALANIIVKEESNKENSLDKDIVYTKLQEDIIESINENIKYEPNASKSLLRNLVNGKKVINQNKDDGEYNFGIEGSIVRFLKPENTLKLEIDGIEFGYLYVERETDNAMRNNNYGFSNDYFNSRSDVETKNNSKTRDDLIANIFLNGISKKIDNKLIKDNKEFKNYLYVLLKQNYITNKRVRITYLRPDEVEHFSLNKQEVYGESQLAKSLFFGKIYLATLMTEMMGKISRSRDKRMIYVETGLDDDVEGVVQEVVRDVKSKEIQTDMLRNITTIFQNIGVFDDLYIPLVNGEKSIDFDTLQGMDVSADNDFLEYLMKAMITGTGTPVNYIDASQDVEFSRNLAMQNSTFVRKLISGQACFGPSLSGLLRKLYKNKYLRVIDKEKKKQKILDDVRLEDIKVELPSPISLNLTNINNQASEAGNTMDFITSLFVNDSDENAPKYKLKFKQKLAKDFLPNLDWNKIEETYKQLEIEVKEEDLENKVTNPQNPDESMDNDANNLGF